MLGTKLNPDPSPDPDPDPDPDQVCEHALGTRAALLREADAAQRGGAVARVTAESEEARKDRLEP